MTRDRALHLVDTMMTLPPPIVRVQRASTLYTGEDVLSPGLPGPAHPFARRSHRHPQRPPPKHDIEQGAMRGVLPLAQSGPPARAIFARLHTHLSRSHETMARRTGCHGSRARARARRNCELCRSAPDGVRADEGGRRFWNSRLLAGGVRVLWGGSELNSTSTSDCARLERWHLWR